MRVVGTLFPVEIAGWIASTLRWIAVVIAFGLGPEALQGSPGLHQAGRDCARNQRVRMSRNRPASPERRGSASTDRAVRSWAHPAGFRGVELRARSPRGIA